MTTTQAMIREWFKDGKSRGYTHMIVVCDTFSYEDYPEYVSPSEHAREKANDINGKNMQRVMEVYNLNIDMESQINTNRCFNY